MTNRTAELLDQAIRCLREVLSGEAIAGLSDAARAEVLDAAGRMLRLSEAVAVELVAASEPGFEHAYGCRSQNELLRRVLRVDAGQATRFGRAVQAVRRTMSMTSGERMPARWPLLREALLDGVVGVSGLLAATGPLEEVHHRVGTAERLQADADLAAYARGETAAPEGASEPAATPEELKQAAYEWAMALDPDGAEPSDRRAQVRRSFSIGPLHDGFHRAQGALLPEVAAQLQLIFDAYGNPKAAGAPQSGTVAFLPDGGDACDPSAGEDDPFNGDPRGVIDGRTAAQRRHDALAAALGIAARHEEMPKLGGAAPTLVVHVDAADYAAGTGWASIPGTLAPVPVSVAAHTACAGGVQRVLFDEGRIVGISVTDRIFTAHQRRAIILRDKECLIPGCHVPASWCEIHHVIEHQDGGPTHTDNGVPLCWWHHRNLDPRVWEIRTLEGVPQIRGPAWWDADRLWRTPRHSLPEHALPEHALSGVP
ncbi:HNH endonuclease signature motif containing protein [Microbacterium tumbae]